MLGGEHVVQVHVELGAALLEGCARRTADRRAAVNFDIFGLGTVVGVEIGSGPGPPGSPDLSKPASSLSL